MQVRTHNFRYCDGVDLNCGCPQRWAKQLGLGCSMLEKPQLIADLVRQCRNKIPKPFSVSVKMRLLQDEKFVVTYSVRRVESIWLLFFWRRTVEVCRQLEKAGVSFLTVHSRTASQLTGSINKGILKTIVDSVSCPVIGNGDLKTFDDCERLREDTGCRGRIRLVVFCFGLILIWIVRFVCLFIYLVWCL